MTGAPPISRVNGKRKTKVGHVVSDRMDKTIVVSVQRLARHPLYKRVIARRAASICRLVIHAGSSVASP